jgi:predicted RNA-binding Zn ribbon-like protein
MTAELAGNSRDYLDSFMLLGDHLAVDFLNTAPNVAGAVDRLISWPDLVGFLAATGTVSRDRVVALRDLANDAPVETVALLRSALQLRTAIRQIMGARISGEPLAADAIGTINDLLQCTEGYDRLMPVGEPGKGESDWRLGLVARSQGLEWLLAAIARSAAELVTEGPSAPVRICANPKCGLFFYDDSRTGTRRWCSMATCGNRKKVAAHFRRWKGTKK